MQLRFVLGVVDATVWPSSTQYMMDSVGFLQNVVSISNLSIGHVQLPLFHPATSMNTILKNTHRLQLALLNGDLDISSNVTLLFSKEGSRQGSDKRPLTQNCVAISAGKTCRWQECDALQSGVLGPLPLLKVSEMQGYDPESGQRPGAAARLEQMLALNL